MALGAMRYKDYVWPHNPQRYQVSFRRKLAAHKLPFGTAMVQDLGASYRVMEGEGTFAGAGAYEEFQRLLEVFDEGGVGLLVHPVWRAERAYFAELALTEEPREDYVHYRFTFWEAGQSNGTLVEMTARENTSGSGGGSSGGGAETAASAGGKTHTVVSGDTLWGIARRYGVALADVIAANPQIKNPNLIYRGEQVVIP